ncbi:fluoroquinolone export ABC transporter permease subunit [Candidatus Contubernalis alkaliaceticus]|uniref:fluoroquinolone export ABC transporter permease subunit n=1 Tax=Candidatus Contubernalis alkaliaceticus TaxID=338645 RepID=UPI001F4C4107|nr:ABC transporter [Candidatus Contubernalis alkalaceticus]UNC92004.1 ABC transporter [Candidatus Contubernalis alkalaceticus]
MFICDIRYQYKYGFYFLYAVIAAAYIGILFILPEEWLRPAAALIILSDPAALGFFFIGGIVLLEKGEGLHSYFSILPAAAGEYVMAKALSLSLISTLVGTVIAAASLGSQVNYLILVVGLLTGSAVFTMFGLMVGTMARSVNHYFVIGLIVGTIIMLPAILTLSDITHPFFEIFPAALLLRLLYGAVGLGLPYNVNFAVIGLIIWVLLIYRLAARRFSLYLMEAGG